jgi:acyl carrier protein
VNAEEIGTIVRKVFATFAPESDVESLDPNAPIQEALDLDSMDFLNAMIAIHDATGVDIPEADYGQVTTLSRIVGYVSARAVSA